MPMIMTQACRGARTALFLGLSLSAAACSRLTDVLDVPPPANVQTNDALKSRGGAEALLASGTSQFEMAMVGNNNVYFQTGMLSDEYGIAARASARSSTSGITTDTRRTSNAAAGTSNSSEPGTLALTLLFSARSSLLIAKEGLLRYELPAGQYLVGRAYALIGYTELMLAEAFCAGVPLDQYGPDVGVQYGTPLTTDSLLGVAEAHFDSALAHANGDTTVKALASIGLGRARLGRKNYAGAAEAVAGVATAFMYPIKVLGTMPSTLYLNPFPTPTSCGSFGVANVDGGRGFNFVRARDPRLVVDSTLVASCDYVPAQNVRRDTSFVWYPKSLGFPTTTLPLASGIEARLIEAEAALNASQTGAWATKLNDLRAAAPTTWLRIAAMPALTSDSTTGAATDAARIDVMFRERAFWLFGTGARLGDMRRLIRQYGRTADQVFPNGNYFNSSNPTPPYQTYGTDVSLSLPTADGTMTNPAYRGCLTSAGDA